MKRLLWTLVAISISTAVYFTIRFGLRPKPIPVMNATEFEDPQQIGAVIYKRLRQNIRPERVIVLGSLPELGRHEQVWAGLLKTAMADHIQIVAFYQSDQLQSPEALPGLELVPFTEAQVQSGELSRNVGLRLQVGKLVVIHAPTLWATHLSKISLSRALEEVVQHPVLSISTLAISLRPEDQSKLRLACQDLSNENETQQRLDCASGRVSRTLIKKHLEPGKIWAVMERHGLQEYLVFIHQ